MKNIFGFAWFADSNLNRLKNNLFLLLQRHVTTKPKQWKKNSESRILHEIKAIISHTAIKTVVDVQLKAMYMPKNMATPFCSYIMSIIYNSQIK